MMRRDHWMRIDNAGKIFPAVSNEIRSSTFRLSMYINEKVDSELLEKVVNDLLPRFDTFNVKIKNGLFWNYFAANNNYFKVEEENAIIGQYKLKSPSLYCFRVLYFQNRITLETFHSISDGTGAMEFLKSIVYMYLKEKGYELDNEGKIYSEKVINPYEKLDAFSYNYDKKNKLSLKEEQAFKLKGDNYPSNWNLFIKTSFKTTDFIRLTHKKNVTATQYMVALLIYSIYLNEPTCKKSKKPIKIFVPVNLRKFFNQETLRNFSLYIRVCIYANKKEWTFDDILEETKKQFEEQLNKNNFIKRISANVFFEKNFFIRILPLFIKNIAFKVAYYFCGPSVTTSYISNLGVIDLPNTMENYIEDVDFVNAGENLYLTMVTIRERMNVIFSTRLYDKSIIYHIIKSLQKEGLEVEIHSNYEDDVL